MSYLGWHYSYALSSGLSIFWNVLGFLFSFFSIKDFLRTFFAPWKRMRESTPSVFDFSNFYESVVINILMRFVGMFMKTIVMMIGMLTVVLYVFLSIALAIVWLILPITLFVGVIAVFVPIVSNFQPKV